MSPPRPHPRPPYFRKAIRWGCVPVALITLVLMVWLEGRVWTSKFGWWAWFDFFNLEVGHVVPAPPEFDPAFAWGPGKHSKEMWFHYERPTPTASIPIIWLALLAIASSVIAWWLDARATRAARAGRCPTGGCNYDRTGLPPSSPCPECNTPPPLPPPPPPPLAPPAPSSSM